MTYMVMETHLSYSVVLDEAGRFLKVANMNHEIGQTVEQVVPIDATEKKVIPIRMISAIGAVAACFVLIFSLFWSNYMSPVASIYLTINPEVRMEISRKDAVVGLEGVNEDGTKLIIGYSPWGKSITQVADDLVDRAIDMGFLSDGGMVTIGIDAPDEAWFASTGIALRQNLNDHLSDRMTVTIEVKQYSQPESSAPVSSRDDASNPVDASAVQSPTRGDSGYGDSGYAVSDNDSGYGEQAAPSSSAPAAQSVRNNDSGYGDSAYSSSAPSEQDGDSSYDASNPDDDSGDSGYQESDEDDSDSGYDSDENDSDSGYASDEDDSDSGYNDTDDDD